MKLNGSNRRRDLERRRKLMPEPRRVQTPQDGVQEPEVLQEIPAGIIRNRSRVNVERVEPGTPEPVTVWSR